MTVTEADTAETLGSGDVPVMATPRVVLLCERATCEAIAPELKEGETSVGMRVEMAHLQPVAIGQTVTAEASVERTEGRRVVFTVSVTSPNGLVAAGKITRAIVDRARFLERLGD
jgi:predicted thioesterase